MSGVTMLYCAGDKRRGPVQPHGPRDWVFEPGVTLKDFEERGAPFLAEHPWCRITVVVEGGAMFELKRKLRLVQGTAR